MKSENKNEVDIYRAINEFIRKIDDCPREPDSEDYNKYYSKYYYKRKFGNNEAGSRKAAYQQMKDRMEKLKAAVAEFEKF